MPHLLSSSGVQLRGGSSISSLKSCAWVDVDGASCCPTKCKTPLNAAVESALENGFWRSTPSILLGVGDLRLVDTAVVPLSSATAALLASSSARIAASSRGRRPARLPRRTLRGAVGSSRLIGER
jgi:hypothetical protein